MNGNEQAPPSGAGMRALAQEALTLVRRVERTGGVARSIRHPGVAPEWWRGMMREAQADYWSDQGGPDRHRHLFACATLADLAADGAAGAVERVSAPSDQAALLGWLRSDARRASYVRTARLLQENGAAAPDTASPTDASGGPTPGVTEGYLYEHREVAWIVEDYLREVAALPPDDPRRRVRDREAELAQAARAARVALQEGRNKHR